MLPDSMFDVVNFDLIYLFDLWSIQFFFSSNENLRPKNEDAREWAQGMSRLLASPCKDIINVDNAVDFDVGVGVDADVAIVAFNFGVVSVAVIDAAIVAFTVDVVDADDAVLDAVDVDNAVYVVSVAVIDTAIAVAVAVAVFAITFVLVDAIMLYMIFSVKNSSFSQKYTSFNCIEINKKIM